jgi:hypothetical protein
MLKSSWTHPITPSRNFVGCGDDLSFEVPHLASDTLLTTLHPLLVNVLQTVCRKLQEDKVSGDYLASELPFHGWKSPEIAWGEIWTPQA